MPEQEMTLKRIKRHKKIPNGRGSKLAGLKGLEPSTFCVTGRRSKPAELQPHRQQVLF